jgi:phosphomannomutase/phosphoglucomutase
MNSLIFRAYDIRGLVNPDLPLDQVYLLGRALGTFFRRQGKRRIVLGRDCRLSSEELAEQMQAALVASGCRVIDIGICPTPVLYFAVRSLEAEGGVMVTASHNPPDFNGFKICNGYHPCSEAEIQFLKDLTLQGQFISGQGSLDQRQVVPAYLEHLREDVKISRPLKIGIDGGHGTAGPIALKLFRHLGCEVVPLYCEMDGRFPAHLPDPAVAAHLTDLQDLVRRHSLDLGVAYDGDGDRLGVVGPQGEIIWGDQLLIIFARDVLKRCPGAAIIGEVKCSQRLFDDIGRRGGRPIMWKAGYALIREKMAAENAPLAGEMSGHLFFADRYLGYGDAIYATGRLLELLADTGQTITQLLGDLPPAAITPEIRWECPDQVKFQLVEQLKTRLTGKLPFTSLDGIRIQFPDGWSLVRASNTQPALVLRFEAATAARLQEIQTWMESLLRREMQNFEMRR